MTDHFLNRFINKPTAAEQAKADRRVSEYLASLPTIDLEKARWTAAVCATMERESETGRFRLIKRIFGFLKKWRKHHE